MGRGRGDKFTRRKEAMKKKARELVTRCGVEVAMFCAYPGDLLTWPSKQAVLAAARRFNALPPEEREENSEDFADHCAGRLGVERDKLARTQAGGLTGAFGSWDGSLEGMPVEKLRGLLASIDASLAAVRSRAAALEQQPQNGGAPDCDRLPPGPVDVDEAAAETSTSVRARGATNEADADGDVSAPPREENPTKAPNAAAPLFADQVTAENSASSTAPGAGNGVQRRRLCEADALELPLEASPGTPNAVAPLVADDAEEGGDERDDVQILQPPGDADHEWMRDLEEALREIPSPSNAAPYWSEAEYVHLGRGFAMERDAYDFICFDLGMPPPYIGPDWPDLDDDEPIQLWSWE
ncbi:hypothetical protein QOZ80_1AG0043970 [Eleusine coracana subsp. coracana]|nr:hypothetical protein QOZ80_1AG0043970 [Eleusine coracana subsp. coracana]